MPNNEICPAEEVQKFVQYVGAGPSGKYLIRRQHQIDGKLHLSYASSETEEDARKLFETPQEGLTFAVIVGPKGEIVETFGCPMKQDPEKAKEGEKKSRWWLWPLILGLVAVTAVGVVIYVRKRKSS
jgi:hypothetical protein